MSEIQAGLHAIATEPSNAPIVRRFVRFAVAMAVVPLITYGITVTSAKFAVSVRLITGVGASSPPILAGLTAVLSLNLIAGIFAVGALQADTRGCLPVNPPEATNTSDSSSLIHSEKDKNE